MLKNGDGVAEQWVIYKANKAGYSAIYMIPADEDKRKAITLLKGDYSAKFESLHLLTSGVDQYDNRLLAFSSKFKARDVIYIYDLEKRSVIRRFEFDSLAAITSPRFSPNGASVVFSGSRVSGYSDIYILKVDDGSITRLTEDIYQDVDPCFGSDGRSVIFSSDRGENGYEGYLSLYRLWLDDGSRQRLTYGPYHDRGPDESPDGSRILFSSDRGGAGAFNIFSLASDGNMSQVTRYITGAYDPRFGSDADEIYFSAWQKMGFHIFKSDLSDTVPVVAEIPRAVEGAWFPGRLDHNAKSTTVKYETDYSLDIAQSMIAFDEVYGALGGVQVAMSDILGDNTIVFLLSNTARSKDDFLSSFNVAVTYLRRISRLNWGLGAFHLYDQYYNDYDGYYYERMFGGVASISYPFTKFDRVESSVFIRHSYKEFGFGLRDRIAVPATHTLSFVADNTLWEPTGPLEGRRLNLTVGYTYDFKTGRQFNRLVLGDFRHYLRLGYLSSLASRFFAFSSAGEEPQRVYLGGSWSFRGYSRRHFYNRNVLFNSEEVRFPLINDLLLAFPLGNFRLRGIRGAIFHDMGAAWDDSWPGWRGSFGASLRIALGYLVVLRLDFARTHNFKTISNKTRVDFFFGWNF